MGEVFDDTFVAVGAILVFEEQNGAAVAEGFLHSQPVVEVAAFAAGVGEQDVDGAFAEEELMGVFVDALAAEVPDVSGVGVASSGWRVGTGNCQWRMSMPLVLSSGEGRGAAVLSSLRARLVLPAPPSPMRRSLAS